MSVEENKAIALRFFVEIWNQGKVELLDACHALDAPSETASDTKELRKRILWWHQAAPGLRFTPLEVVAEDDRVVVYWNVDFTYSVTPEPPPDGPMPPLGKPLHFKGFDIMRMRDGKIVWRESVNGWNGMMIDAGMYAPTKTAAG